MAVDQSRSRSEVLELADDFIAE